MEKMVTLFYGGLKRWLRETPAPVPDKISFTLSEFAGHFEALSELVDVPTDEEFTEISKGLKFKRETLLFKWMLESETENEAQWALFSAPSRLLTGRDRGTGKANPADMSELRSSARASMFVELNLVVEDDEVCGPPTRIRVRSAFEKDAQLLSALASGTLQNIHRLETALSNFTQSIDEALLKLSGDWWKSNRATSFIHAYFFGPVFNFVTEYFRRKERQETLQSMGVRMRSTLQLIKDQIPQKFGLNFTNTDSPLQTYKRELFDMSTRYFSPTRSSLTTPLEPEYKGVLRLLPQRTKLVVFFPSSPTGETNYAEKDVDAAVAVRQSSAFTDSCKVFNEMSQDATHLLSNMKDMLPSINFVHSFYIPRSESFGRVLKPAISFNALHVNTPVAVQHSIDTARIPEKLRARLLSVTSVTSTTSAKRRPTTPLDALGLPDTHYALAASAVFCQLLSEELVASARATEKAASAATLVQGPFQSTLERMRNSFKYVREHSKNVINPLLAEEEDRECTLGTRSGRDAVYVLQVSGVHALRGKEAAQQAIITRLCDAGDAVVRLLLSVDGDLSVARRMPSEPLSSLFLDRATGPNAFLRISTLASLARLDLTTPSSARLLWSVASSYASNYLVDRQFAPTELPKLSKPSPPGLGCARAMTRMASMRLDIDEGFVSGDTNVAYDTIDDLTKGLATVTLRIPVATFYAPFGYGDAPPVLKCPASAPSLLGSVPVWCEHMRRAMKQVATPFAASPRPQPGNDAYVIEFVYEPCVLNVDTVQKTLATPELIKVEEVGTQRVATVYGAVPPTSANPAADVADDARALQVHPTAREAVDSLSDVFAQTGATAPFREVVSAILWNVDRLVQGTLALLTVCATTTTTMRRYLYGCFHADRATTAASNSTD